MLFSQTRTFSKARHVVLEARGDVDAAGAGVARVDRAEELVRLQDELAAEAVLVVDDERAHAGAAQLDGGREAGRAAADDQALGLDRSGCRAAVRPGSPSRRRGARDCPSSGATRMPARTGTMQDFTGRPSAITVHWAHWPLAQKMPCGAPSLWWWPKTRTPLAKSADEIVSPSKPAMGWPFQENSTDVRGCDGKNRMFTNAVLDHDVTPYESRVLAR